MIRLILFLLMLTPIANHMAGQSSTTTKDPKAKAILDKLKKQLDAYKTMEVKFDLETEIPGKPLETFKGTLIQDGQKYQVKMSDREIYNNGTSIWVYLKNQKEVQINEAEDGGEEFLSPREMMNLYQSGKFDYVLFEERKVGSTTFADIEFKPLAKNYDYSKIRMTVDKKENKMVSLRMFSKDGTRINLKLTQIIPNKKYDPSIFSFNPKAVKGVHIEDLRMN